MTALKPTELRMWRAVTSGRYPLNELCSMPECYELTDDPHHIFPRSMIAGDSWFVAPYQGATPDAATMPTYDLYGEPIPHVTGLCRAHHDDVEEHRAWIKLDEGEFYWYDRHTVVTEIVGVGELPEWELIGSLDPQPARGEKARKPVRRLQGEERRKRKRVSIAIPDDYENGGQLWDEMLDDMKDWLHAEGVFGDRNRIPNWEALYAVYIDWTHLRRHTPREEEHGIESTQTQARH